MHAKVTQSSSILGMLPQPLGKCKTTQFLRDSNNEMRIEEGNWGLAPRKFSGQYLYMEKDKLTFQPSLSEL